MESSNKNFSIYVAWFICTAFFFFQYILRVFPNIISNEIFDTFKLTAEEFSMLGALYYLIYGAAQIPIGFLLDRTNLKTVSLVAILLCMAGGIMFGLSDDFHSLQTSRIVLALGSAAALPIALKVISTNFDGITRSLLSGITLTIGVIGPFIGGNMIEIFLDLYDWRIVVISIGISGFVLFLASFFFVKDTRHDATSGFRDAISQIKVIFNIRILIYALIAGGIYAPVCVFGDLWGSRFISNNFNIPEAEATSISVNLYLGLAIGSLVLPYLSEQIKKLHGVIIASMLINAVLFGVILLTPELNAMELSFLVGAIGFFCGSEMICFNAAWCIVPKNCTGTTTGVINSFSLIFNALFNQAVGYIMDMTWEGRLSDTGIRIYSKDNFILGMSSIPMVLVTCVAVSLLLLNSIRKNNV